MKIVIKKFDIPANIIRRTQDFSGPPLPPPIDEDLRGAQSLQLQQNMYEISQLCLTQQGKDSRQTPTNYCTVDHKENKAKNLKKWTQIAKTVQEETLYSQRKLQR